MANHCLPLRGRTDLESAAATHPAGAILGGFLGFPETSQNSTIIVGGAEIRCALFGKTVSMHTGVWTRECW